MLPWQNTQSSIPQPLSQSSTPVGCTSLSGAHCRWLRGPCRVLTAFQHCWLPGLKGLLQASNSSKLGENPKAPWCGQGAGLMPPTPRSPPPTSTSESVCQSCILLIVAHSMNKALGVMLGSLRHSNKDLVGPVCLFQWVLTCVTKKFTIN